MLFKAIVVGALSTNCYIIGDEQTGEALVIDPGAEGERVSTELADLKLKPLLIVSTHSHLDHTGGVTHLRQATVKAHGDAAQPPYAVHANDAPTLHGDKVLHDMLRDFDDPPVPERLLRDGEAIKVGRLSVQVLGTPGHTPGSICLYLADDMSGGPGVVFTGDTLFQMSIGRYDFPGGSISQELDSIRTKLLVLPEATRVCPGHGPQTTIGKEKQMNPFIKKQGS